MNTKAWLAALLIPATFSSAAFSTDLIHVYKQAIDHDQTFAQAHANWLSAKTGLLLAQSSVLPTISLSSGSYTHQLKHYFNDPSKNKESGWSWSYGITINAPIFNAAGWVGISAANDSIKSATATYLNAAQTLISSTINAYLTVLKNYDSIQYNEASKRAYYRQMITAEQQFKVGLKAKTAVYDAQARYDTQVASAIAARTTLRNNLEALTVITGYHYTALNGIRYSVPLRTPNPVNMQAWVTTALKQNFNYQASRYATIAARKKIQAQALAAAPVLAITAAHSAANSAPPSSDYDQYSNTNGYGLGLSFTPFAGGNNIALTAQARHDYEAQSALQLYTYRNVISSTRQAYLGITLGISKIRADRQSIQSAKKSLDATKQGYTVGTNTMTDVLDSISTYYQAQQTYMDDQYDYLSSIVSLKLAAGTLSYKDVLYINKLLQKRISLKRFFRSSHKVNAAITPIIKKATLRHSTPIKKIRKKTPTKKASLNKKTNNKLTNISTKRLTTNKTSNNSPFYRSLPQPQQTTTT